MMKNLLFVLSGLLITLLIVFAAYNKIMFGDEKLLMPAIVGAITFSFVSLLDIGNDIFKKNQTGLIWFVLFIQFSGLAQMVYYSRKLMAKKA